MTQGQVPRAPRSAQSHPRDVNPRVNTPHPRPSAGPREAGQHAVAGWPARAWRSMVSLPAACRRGAGAAMLPWCLREQPRQPPAGSRCGGGVFVSVRVFYLLSARAFLCSFPLSNQFVASD